MCDLLQLGMTKWIGVCTPSVDHVKNVLAGVAVLFIVGTAAPRQVGPHSLCTVTRCQYSPGDLRNAAL